MASLWSHDDVELNSSAVPLPLSLPGMALLLLFGGHRRSRFGSSRAPPHG